MKRVKRNDVSFIKTIVIEGVITVSYTHLDVYKRQGLNRLTKTTLNTTTPLEISYTYQLSERNEGSEDYYRTTKVLSLIHIFTAKNGEVFNKVSFKKNGLKEMLYSNMIESKIGEGYTIIKMCIRDR